MTNEMNYIEIYKKNNIEMAIQLASCQLISEWCHCIAHIWFIRIYRRITWITTVKICSSTSRKCDETTRIYAMHQSADRTHKFIEN